MEIDTAKSKKMASDFLARGTPFKRKIQTYTRRFDAPAAVVYEQLCPTREADWIEGWVADLIYTESGYSEPDCVLSTPDSNILGAGLWIITQTREPGFHEFVVIREDGVVGHFTIELTDTAGGACDTRWRLVFTATTEEANAIVDAMPDADPGFDAAVLGSLEHFLQTGQRMELAR